ncbi:MAG: DUF3795 domain-containing protein [Spirochaetota bacterium]|nr:DUF3795 domain-containing protein [Spirochaetota bacterium]
MSKGAELIAACGLYCANCGKYTKGKCPGCLKNEKATWCAVRSCCIENKFTSCADCGEYTNPRDCKKFRNPIASIMGFLFNTDRAAGICRIREKGGAALAAELEKSGRMGLPRAKKGKQGA